MKQRLNIEISEDLARLLDQLSDEEQTTKTEIVRRGLSIMKAFRAQMRAGRNHIGFTSDPAKLEAEIVGILTDSGADSREAAIDVAR
jgi:hypothetical protein